jgi:DNA invertase Pin-like site-specific DNA recombinase
MTRAAIYARVSRPDEKDILQNQLRACEAYCVSRAYDVTRRYTEIVSGAKDDRAAMNDLLREATTIPRPFDVVVVTSLSRLTRKGIESALYYLYRFDQARVKWAFVEQPILSSESDAPDLAKDVLFAVLAAIDKDFRSRIQKHTKAAYARKKALAEARGEKVRWGRHPRTCGCPKHAGKSGPLATTSQTSEFGIAPISEGDR